MSLESMIGNLTHAEKLAAMDLLWRDLSNHASGFDSPEWHKRVLEERLANPAPEGSLPLDEAKAKIRRELGFPLSPSFFAP
ncbi:MAG: addiction module protein [Pirellulaceae bacterium]